ncbi:DUF680 domain-containing protein [Mesorhizobium tamadayense]|uniref:DUF680 domain-containing protein n=1 Tax=Mesorhizobium tamadayense TaxID=425306 RepID=A0A3P3F4G7_9HYPH|nr:DUF680 domain-containing protein [Mesorhizobium tamadayense]RRH93539.1 DUF680 domain-containing protein [Mesorhizobium tamadayense]
MRSIKQSSRSGDACDAAAFAGSENYGSNNANQPTVAVDRTVTALITKINANVQKPLTQGADRNLFGNH